MKKAADTMNQKMKVILLLLLTAVLTLITGCSAEDTPYQVNDRENFTVSVRFDANGGWFTTNTSVIVNSYDISQIKADADGKVRVPLLAPDDPAKKNEAFAHWSSLFSGGNYPDTVMFIVSEMPELLVKIQNFVAGI